MSAVRLMPKTTWLTLMDPQNDMILLLNDKDIYICSGNVYW
jgi:hypothetical protein